MSHVEVKQFLKQMMMRHMKANAYLYPHLETWWKTSGLMDESWYLSEASSSHTDHPESAHQRFYSFCFHEACGPLEAGNRLQQLFQEWLGQESLSKEQISELLVLEQFLTILPGDIQQWVRKYQPQSIREAVALTEHFQRGPTTASNENVVTFEDVIVRFSEEEWKLLSHSQKTLCNDVMQETYEDALFLGLKLKNVHPTSDSTAGCRVVQKTRVRVTKKAPGKVGDVGPHSVERGCQTFFKEEKKENFNM